MVRASINGEVTWRNINRSILEALDIEAEYVSWGVDVVGSPNSRGWTTCRAVGREDKNPSAAININTGAYKDHGGDGDSFSFFEAAVHFGDFADWKAARDHFAKKTGTRLPEKKKSPGSQLEFRDWNDALAQAWCNKKSGIQPHSLPMAGARMAMWPKKWKTHPVIALPSFGPSLQPDDASGWVIFNRTGGTLPLKSKNGPPEELKMLSVRGSSAGLMNAWFLEHFADAEVLWKVEGPSDMLALQSIIPEEMRKKHVVTTNSSGSLGSVHDWMLDPFAGKAVHVLHDADEPGQGGAAKWCQALAPVAKECRNVQLPYEVSKKHGKDLRDWISEGHTYEELLSLAESAPVVDVLPAESARKDTGNSDGSPTPDDDEFANERVICRQLRIVVLGETEAGTIRFFSEFHRKTVSVTTSALQRHRMPWFHQSIGQPAREFLTEGDSPQTFKIHIDSAKNAIAMMAGLRRITEESEVGPGCWPGKEHEKSIVLVRAGEAAEFSSNGKFDRILRPNVDGRLLDLSTRRAWYDFHRLEGYIEKAQHDRDFRLKTVNALIDLLRQWTWQKENAAEIIAGLVLATWVQSVWTWRPLVSVTGPTHSGKTFLLETLAEIFGGANGLAILSSRSTEAGIRQAIRNGGYVIMCDEFEDSLDRQKVLELLRTSSRGSTVLRGTAGHEGFQVGLRHIAWVAAIETGLERAPDRNRFIHVELKKPERDRFGKLRRPPQTEMRDLGQRFLACAIVFAHQAAEMAERIKEHPVPGIDPRLIESYSVPAAALACVAGEDDAKARKLLESFVEEIDPMDQTHSDENDLLQAILSSRVELGRGEKSSVGRILETRSESDLNLLADHGIRIIAPYLQPGEFLFFATSVVKRYLLRGTCWEHQRTDILLRRIRGATPCKQKIHARSVRGVMIPVEGLFDPE